MIPDHGQVLNVVNENWSDSDNCVLLLLCYMLTEPVPSLVPENGTDIK